MYVHTAKCIPKRGGMIVILVPWFRKIGKIIVVVISDSMKVNSKGLYVSPRLRRIVGRGNITKCAAMIQKAPSLRRPEHFTFYRPRLLNGSHNICGKYHYRPQPCPSVRNKKNHPIRAVSGRRRKSKGQTTLASAKPIA